MKTLLAMFMIVGFSAHAKPIETPKLACGRTESGNLHTAPRYISSNKVVQKPIAKKAPVRKKGQE